MFTSSHVLSNALQYRNIVIAKTFSLLTSKIKTCEWPALYSMTDKINCSQRKLNWFHGSEFTVGWSKIHFNTSQHNGIMRLRIYNTEDHRWSHCGNLANIFPFSTNQITQAPHHLSTACIVLTPDIYFTAIMFSLRQWEGPLRGQPFLSPQCLKVCKENNSWNAVITA